MNWKIVTLVGACLAFFGSVPSICRAADDIKFSEPASKLEFRTPGEIDAPKSSRIEFLDRGDSLGGVISGGTYAPPSTPNPRINRRVGDRWLDLDRKLTPDSQSALEQAVGIDERWSSRARTSKSEQFWSSDEFPLMNSETRDTKESKDHKAQNRSLQKDHSLKTSSRNLRDGSDPKETASDIHTSPGVFDLNRPLAAGVVLPTALWNSSTEDFRPGETPLAPTHLNEDSAALREGRPESLRTVLGNTGGINPLAKGFDPINLTVDATRQPVNPVLPVSPVPGLANPLNSPLLQTPESALEKRLAPAESRALDLRIEALGSSSLSPNISTPAVEAAPKPYTPGPTQFPTRRF